MPKRDSVHASSACGLVYGLYEQKVRITLARMRYVLTRPIGEPAGKIMVTDFMPQADVWYKG